MPMVKQMKGEVLWELEGEDVCSKHAFYELLGDSASNKIENRVYQPDILRACTPKERNIRNIEFVQVSFAKTKLVGIRFTKCVFKQCLFIDSRLSGCEFHDCRFIATNTYKIDIVDTYIDPKSFRDCLDRTRHQNLGVHLFQKLLKNNSNEGQIEFARDARFLFLRWKRYQVAYDLRQQYGHKKKFRTLVNWLSRWLWEMFLGSGVKLTRLLWTAIGVVSIFTMLNYCFRYAFGLKLGNYQGSEAITAPYYTIVSLTTLGYGDIVPHTELGQMVAAFQSIVGFILFAMLASMLFRRASPLIRNSLKAYVCSGPVLAEQQINSVTATYW